MKYFLIRHGKTDAYEGTGLTFGKEGAPLNKTGEAQAAALAKTLTGYGIDVNNEPAASSELLRAQQTAQGAGFKHIVTNPLLNEINTSNPKRTPELLAKGLLPEEAIVAARALLANPPEARIWVTHGLVIMALQEVLNSRGNDSFIPGYCEIRSITIEPS